jgi:hypothetical protein
LRVVPDGRSALETALDQERRELIHANEQQLLAYLKAAEPWEQAWPAVLREMADLPLAALHRMMVEPAEGVLPFTVEYTGVREIHAA